MTNMGGQKVAKILGSSKKTLRAKGRRQLFLMKPLENVTHRYLPG